MCEKRVLFLFASSLFFRWKKTLFFLVLVFVMVDGSSGRGGNGAKTFSPQAVV